MVSIDNNLLVGLAVAVAFALLIAIPRVGNRKLLVVLSAMAAAAFFRREFAGFLIVSAIAYAVVCWLSAQPPAGRRWPLACAAIVVLAVVFTLGRVQHWDRPALPTPLGPIAVYSLGMWPALKLVTLFWEVGAGSVAKPSVSGYFLWTCLPFTLGGPILRWSEMPKLIVPEPRLFKSAAWWRGGVAATAKLIAGISLAAAQTLLATRSHAHYLNNAVSTFVTGPLSFYLTTAGYFHWMQLLALPTGIKLPDSFNYPIGRENISAFWMNWNMTATFVFRDYLFYNRWGGQTYNVYVNTIVLFTLVGLWHAANAYWIIWGFLHGLLFCSFLLWRKYNHRFSIPMRGTTVSRTVARLFTYFCVCMAWYLPSKILQKLGLS